jgi:hypothetical protein
VLAPLPLRQLGDRAIRDTAAAVFREAAYNRDRSSPWMRKLGEWLERLIDALGRLLGAGHEHHGESRVTFWIAAAVLAAALLLALGRAAYLAWVRREQFALGRVRWPEGARAQGDAWELAQRLAARGEFTEAAHALYRALLEAAARQGQVRLHPSKTVGDYVRELRARSSGLLGRFRDFARSYEVVIYGIGTCDRERYERLHALAQPVVRPAAGG